MHQIISDDYDFPDVTELHDKMLMEESSLRYPPSAAYYIPSHFSGIQWSCKPEVLITSWGQKVSQPPLSFCPFLWGSAYEPQKEKKQQGAKARHTTIWLKVQIGPSGLRKLLGRVCSRLACLPACSLLLSCNQSIPPTLSWVSPLPGGTGASFIVQLKAWGPITRCCSADSQRLPVGLLPGAGWVAPCLPYSRRPLKRQISVLQD